MGQGGEISNLPIVFDFGLLKQHKMGGWETGDNEDEYFSFTFKVTTHFFSSSFLKKKFC